MPNSTKHMNIPTFFENIKSRQLWLMHLIDFNIVWILLECTTALLFCPFLLALSQLCSLLHTSWCEHRFSKPPAVQICSSSLAAVYMKYEDIFFPSNFQLLSFTVDSSQHFLNYIGIRCHLLELSKKPMTQLFFIRPELFSALWKCSSDAEFLSITLTQM